MAILDQTLLTQITNIKIDYKKLAKQNAEYEKKLKTLMERVEQILTLWFIADRDLVDDSVINQSGIIQIIQNTGIFNTYISHKQSIANVVSGVTIDFPSLENVKIGIQNNVLNTLNGWWQYESYLNGILADPQNYKKNLNDLEVKKISLDKSINEVAELSARLTAEQVAVIHQRKVEFDSAVTEGKSAIEKIKNDYSLENQNKIADKYAYVFEERAEGVDWFKLWFLTIKKMVTLQFHLGGKLHYSYQLFLA